MTLMNSKLLGTPLVICEQFIDEVDSTITISKPNRKLLIMLAVHTSTNNHICISTF